jgi:amino acid transporter
MSSPSFPEPLPSSSIRINEKRHESTNVVQELPSARLPSGWLPQVLSAKDLTILGLMTVMLVTNISLLAGAGGAAFIYWLLGFLFFLIPSALVCAQLYRLFPGEGAVYVWANKAFGNFWDTFVGLYCNWLPGVLGMTIGVVSVVTYLQALNSNWLTLPWQQGMVEIVVLILSLGLCSFAQRRIQTIINIFFFAYSGIFVLLGLAGIVWLATGHAAQGDFSLHGWQIGPGNWPVFAVMIISLFGMEVPLNMGGEVANQRAVGRYLLWGTGITIGGYLLATFGITVVLPPQDAVNSALIAEVFSRAFGSTIGGALQVIVNIIFVCYFVNITVAFNVMFSRLLLLSGVDRRLPLFVRRLTRNQIPFNAMLAQTCINIGFVLVIFFIAPAFAPANQTLSLVVFLVTINGGSVIWNFAMIGLFLSGIILCTRYRQRLKGSWIVPPVFLYIGSFTGILCSCIAIYLTLFGGSPIPQLLNNADWIYWMLVVVLSSLSIGAAYSFLVPETEDLVSLINTKARVQPPQLTTSQRKKSL